MHCDTHLILETNDGTQHTNMSKIHENICVSKVIPARPKLIPRHRNLTKHPQNDPRSFLEASWGNVRNFENSTFSIIFRCHKKSFLRKNFSLGNSLGTTSAFLDMSWRTLPGKIVPVSIELTDFELGAFFWRKVIKNPGPILATFAPQPELL